LVQVDFEQSQKPGRIILQLGKAPPSKPFTGDVTVKCVCTECNNGWGESLIDVWPTAGSSVVWLLPRR